MLQRARTMPQFSEEDSEPDEQIIDEEPTSEPPTGQEPPEVKTEPDKQENDRREDGLELPPEDMLLDAIAALHEQTVEDRMARLLAMVEPGMMMLVGVILGAVIITVYLPIFGISGVVQ